VIADFSTLWNDSCEAWVDVGGIFIWSQNRVLSSFGTSFRRYEGTRWRWTNHILHLIESEIHLHQSVVWSDWSCLPWMVRWHSCQIFLECNYWPTPYSQADYFLWTCKCNYVRKYINRFYISFREPILFCIFHFINTHDSNLHDHHACATLFSCCIVTNF
jgi:hypothetical protein